MIKKLIIVLLIAVAVMLTGCAQTDSSYGIGETAEIKKMEITMINSISLPAGKDEEFRIIQFEILNKSNKDIQVSSVIYFTMYCDNKMYPISVDALKSIENVHTADGVIDPDETLHGVVGYKLPSNWEIIEINFVPYPEDEGITFTLFHH